MSRLARVRAFLSFADPLAAPAWVEVTDRLSEWQTVNGRQIDLDTFQTGTAAAVLDNSDRALDPLLTNSALAGAGLVPRRRLKFEAWWNQLTLNQASLETDTTGWSAGANTTITRSTTLALDGVASLRLSSTAAGNVQASTLTGTAGVPVAPGEPWVAMASFRSGASARSARVDVAWYSSTGSLLSTTTGGTITTATGSWTQATTSATAPAGAAFATVTAVVLATAAGAELHYVDQVGLFPADAGTPAWTRGGVEPMFSGFVPSWEPMYSTTGAYGQMVLKAHDALGLFAEMALPDSTWQIEVEADAPDAWYRLGDGDLTMVDASGNGRHGTYSAGYTQAVTAITPSTSDGGRQFIGPSSNSVSSPAARTGFVLSGTAQTFEWWTSTTSSGNVIFAGQDSGAAAYMTVIATGGILDIYWVSNWGASEYTRLQTPTASFPLDGAVRHVAITRSSSTFAVYINGVAQTLTTTTGTTAFNGATSTFGTVPLLLPGPLNMSVDELVCYSTALSAARVLAHYQAGLGWPGDDTGTRLGRVLDALDWPAADRVISTGATLCQAAIGDLQYRNGNALTYMQTLERSEQGQLYIDGAGRVVFRSRWYRLTTPTAVTSQATFGDAGSELGYASIAPENNIVRITNHVVAQRANGGVQLERSDATSRGRFLRRSSTKDQSGLANLSDLEVLDLLQWQIDHYAAADTRIRALTLEPVGTTELWPQVLIRDIGDRVTVRNRLPDGSLVLDKQVHIEGVTRTGRVGPTSVPNVSCTWYLSAADIQQYLIFDDATFGQLDINAFAF